MPIDSFGIPTAEELERQRKGYGEWHAYARLIFSNCSDDTLLQLWLSMTDAADEEEEEAQEAIVGLIDCIGARCVAGLLGFVASHEMLERCSERRGE